MPSLVWAASWDPWRPPFVRISVFLRFSSFLVLVVPWTFVCLFGCRYLQEEDQAKKTSTASQSAAAKRSYPLVLICFGLLSWLAYDIEGSVAEWGSVYMVSSKEADQAVAALVYGLFSGTIFVVRLFGDRLRESVR